MLAEFERLAKQCPQDPCFYFIDDDGRMSAYSFEEVRARSAVLAFQLQKEGVTRKSYVSVDMANCPHFIFLILAAAYGGFSLVVLNHRLTEEEKTARLFELKIMRNFRVALHLDEQRVEHLLTKANFLSPDSAEEPGDSREKRSFFRTKKTPFAVQESRERSEVFHWLEQGVAFFEKSASALVLFTSGSAGRPKAASLTWNNLCGSAKATNTVLGTFGQGMWQVALPLFHIGGFQIVVRSILNATPFMLYHHFDAERILDDAVSYGASHISVVDKMLQDFLATEQPERLQSYRCILLGGAIPNPVTLQRAREADIRLYISYGMTETASMIAANFAGIGYNGSCTLLPGYEAQIISPDEEGIGQLAVRGPGVFDGYLNSRAAFTVDGFFLTGDSASMRSQKITVQERINDMFVSGGENIYPAEIEDKLLRIPQVSDAFVFGVEDEVWGKRPVALLERSIAAAAETENDSADVGSSKALDTEKANASAGFDGAENTCSGQAFAVEVRKSLESRLAKIYRPHHICVMDAFPRTGIGKPDRRMLKQRYEERLEIHEVRLYRIRQQFKTPITTAKTTLRFRESIIVEVIDWAGRSGLGECVAFPTDWYLPETLEQDEAVLKNYLVPLVLDQVYLHPREVSLCFDECDGAAAYPLAKAALEPAFWDLYGKIVEKPLWQLLNEEIKSDAVSSLAFVAPKKESLDDDGGSAEKVAVRAGLVLGILPVEKTLEAVQNAVDEGYSRVKLKVKPGDDLVRVTAVREAFPAITLMLDANQSYVEQEFATLRAFDELDICCIEEPLDPGRSPKVGPTGLFARLARLQKNMKTPICLDESVVNALDLNQALSFPGLRSYALKIAKLGGVTPALAMYKHLQIHKAQVWMGGMYDTGVSKYLHAAFETLPDITPEGDLSSSSNYFEHDLCDPPFEVKEGMVVLNTEGHEKGLGCVLNYETLNKILIDHRSYAR